MAQSLPPPQLALHGGGCMVAIVLQQIEEEGGVGHDSQPPLRPLQQPPHKFRAPRPYLVMRLPRVRLPKHIVLCLYLQTLPRELRMSWHTYHTANMCSKLRLSWKVETHQGEVHSGVNFFKLRHLPSSVAWMQAQMLTTILQQKHTSVQAEYAQRFRE